MTGYSAPMAGAKPETVVNGIHELLRGGPGAPDALGWVSVCVRSNSCVPACPEKVNPMMMVRIARIIASGGLGGPRLIPVHEDRDFFDRVRAFGALQLTEDELKNWT